MDTLYSGPEIIATGRGKNMKLAFIIPLATHGQAAQASVTATRMACNREDILVEVRPGIGEHGRPHAKPGLCLYVEVPEGVADPMTNPVWSRAHVFVHEVAEVVCA